MHRNLSEQGSESAKLDGESIGEIKAMTGNRITPTGKSNHSSEY
jgi:hypothetical protein